MSAATPNFALSRRVSDEVDSSECFDLARKWLNDCAPNHEDCARPPDPYLPTRVVNVGPQDGSSEPFLHITCSERGRYATLSHCSGRSKRLVTTTENIADHSRRIPLAAMARSFRDAVIITRELGIRYLWIDSFCILHDSIEDWRAEAARMASVYENSFMTIAAKDSPDSNIGIFQPRRSVIWPLSTNLLDSPNQLTYAEGGGDVSLMCVLAKQSISRKLLQGAVVMGGWRRRWRGHELGRRAERA